MWRRGFNSELWSMRRNEFSFDSSTLSSSLEGDLVLSIESIIIAKESSSRALRKNARSEVSVDRVDYVVDDVSPTNDDDRPTRPPHKKIILSLLLLL